MIWPERSKEEKAKTNKIRRLSKISECNCLISDPYKILTITNLKNPKMTNPKRKISDKLLNQLKEAKRMMTKEI